MAGVGMHLFVMRCLCNFSIRCCWKSWCSLWAQAIGVPDEGTASYEGEKVCGIVIPMLGDGTEVASKSEKSKFAMKQFLEACLAPLDGNHDTMKLQIQEWIGTWSEPKNS